MIWWYRSLFAPLPPAPEAVPNVAVPADIDAYFTQVCPPSEPLSYYNHMCSHACR
jgi:hypothetical protein